MDNNNDNLSLNGLELSESPAFDDEPIEIEKVKKPDSAFRFLMGQIIICALGILGILAIRFAGGDIYSNMRNNYEGVFCQNTSPSQIIDVMGNFVKRLSNQGTVTASSQIASTDERSTQIAQSSRESSLVSVAPSTVPTAVPTLLQTTQKVKTTTLENSMQMPVAGTVSSEFGNRIHPIYNEELMHRGIDIAADYDSDIKCALSGTVTESDYDDSYGYFIRVKHVGNIETVYAHCSSLLASVGNIVEKGQVIAKVGDSGVSTGPHLHFEIHYKGILINPRCLLNFN